MGVRRQAERPAARPRGAWIWKGGSQAGGRVPYHQTILARRTIELPAASRALLSISADSCYRLSINDAWVGDGPPRGWPEHYRYDRIDVSRFLKDGENRFEVIARFFGVGDFHRIPRRPGLWLELDVEEPRARPGALVSDASWEVAEAAMWIANTPKVSYQMEPQELYDARLETDLRWEPATVVAAREGGPWKDLWPRTTGFLTQRPLVPRAMREAHIVRSPVACFCVPAARLLHPGLIEANRSIGHGFAMATLIECGEASRLRFDAPGFFLAIDGSPPGADGSFALEPGDHFLLACARELFGHEKELVLCLLDPPPLVLSNPVDPTSSNPFCFVPVEESRFVGDDLHWVVFALPERAALEGRYHDRIRRLLEEVRSAGDFRSRLGREAVVFPAEEMLLQDTYPAFRHRQVIGEAGELIEHPSAVLQVPGGAPVPGEATVVHPTHHGDVELVYDFGEQSCGYYEFEIEAPAGTVVDLFGVEYIDDRGTIQHTEGNRNGVRYLCRQGTNRFCSLKRRAGRYLFLTLRGNRGLVALRSLRLIESTYPTEGASGAPGSFHSSDPGLDRLWDAAARTLKLCMEDTFTDCPLYEQTLWVGDLRVEALCAYQAFGAYDIARASLEVAGQSLERYPLVGCQVPSSWDCLLPNWSFLWGLAVWEHYFHTGDRAFLRSAWPWVTRNLDNALGMIDAEGLFTSRFWSLFDFTGIDDQHPTVLITSMLLVGALDAARSCGAVLGERGEVARLGRARRRLVQAINRQWDPARRSYPDAIREVGGTNATVSQHTSALALLFDIVPEALREAATANVTDPPAGMARPGTGFGAFFLWETLDKLGLAEEVVSAVRDVYRPMLKAGATTLWENFPPRGLRVRPGYNPARSHCHGWSAGPLYFFPRVVLGIRQTAPGATEYEISPRLCGLSFARGSVATPQGPLEVAWERDRQRLRVQVSAPNGVRVRVVGNESHAGLRMEVEGG